MPNRTRLLALPVVFTVIILAAVACNDRPLPMDRQEVRAFIEESVKAAVEEALVQLLSRQEFREMVAEAVAKASPGSSQVDVSELGSKATGPTPMTKAEVALLIQAEMASVLGEFDLPSAQAAEVGKPTPTPILISTPIPTPATIRDSTPTPITIPASTATAPSTPTGEITPSQRFLLRVGAQVLDTLQGRVTVQTLSKETRIDEVRTMLFLEDMVDRGEYARFGAPPNVYYERVPR